MALKLTKKVQETGGFYPLIGFAEFDVIALNPTKEQIAEIFNSVVKEDAKETEYEGIKDNDGYPQVILDFWLKARTPEEQIKPIRFYLSKKPAISQNGSFQYVNQSGESTWAASEDKLLSFFTNYEKFGSKDSLGKKEFREAVNGEADLYAFLKTWFSDVNFKDVKTQSNILINIDELFNDFESYINENFRPHVELHNKIVKAEAEAKEFFNLPPEVKKGMNYGALDQAVKDLKRESITGPIVLLAYVKTTDKKDKPGEVNHNQKWYKEPLPTVLWFQKGKKMENVSTMKAIQEAIETDNWETYASLKKFHKNVTDLEHGIKSSYKLCLLEKFNPDEFLAAGGNTFSSNDLELNFDEPSIESPKSVSWNESRNKNKENEMEFDEFGMPKDFGIVPTIDDLPW